MPTVTPTQPPKSVAQAFWRFAIPSIVAMLVSGLYQIIDGFFVGHYVGSEGLAGINMAMPLLGLIMGFGLLIGMGGGSVLSQYRGENNDSATRSTLVTALFLVVGIGLLASLVFTALGKSSLHLQGATGNTLMLSWQYVEIMSYGALISIGASAMPMLVRNDDSPNMATLFIVVGALLNIVLDYIFLGTLGMGLKGAAVATLIAQLATCVSISPRLKQKPFYRSVSLIKTLPNGLYSLGRRTW